jgi:hypothetical protein
LFFDFGIRWGSIKGRVAVQKIHFIKVMNLIDNASVCVDDRGSEGKRSNTLRLVVQLRLHPAMFNFTKENVTPWNLGYGACCSQSDFSEGKRSITLRLGMQWAAAG